MKTERLFRSLRFLTVFLVGAVMSGCGGNEPVDPPVIPVASISVSPASLEMTVASTARLQASVSPSDATVTTVTWTSSNAAVVTVSSTGELTAKSVGTATVTASAGGKSASAAIRVVAQTIPVESVNLSSSQLDLHVGEEATLNATVSPADATDKIITWSSSDPSVATVSEGRVKALKEGTANISASAGGKKAECKVTVSRSEIPVDKVSLDKETIELGVGDSYTLTATVSPADATDKSLTWSSSDTAVATVEGGVVQAVSNGETIVTVSSSNGKCASCRVIVSERFGAVDMGLSVKWANMNLGASDSADGGSFYAWTELVPKTDYSWQTYTYAAGAINTITKYGDVTDTYVLLETDDAAFREKGGSWRMPTKHEFQELLDNCEAVWSDTPAGYSLTSKINGNTLFFPAAGYMEGTELQPGFFCVARYWTASTGSYDGEAAYVGFYNPSRDDVPPGLNSAERCMGYLVRAVEGSRQTVPEAKLSVESALFDFGDVNVGETGRIVVAVSNVGDAELKYSVGLPRIIYSTDNFSQNISIQGNAYGASVVHTVAPGASDTFIITYTPVAAGVEEYSRFYIYSNAVNGNKGLTVRGRSPGNGSSNEGLGYGDWDF